MFKSVRAPMPDPLTVQHGGDHYKSMGIQPVEFAYANGYDDCLFSTLKYVSRHHRKEGILDLDKAIHFVQLRVEMAGLHGECLASSTIPIRKYIEANGIGELEAIILRELHQWGLVGHRDGPDTLIALISELKKNTYT